MASYDIDFFESKQSNKERLIKVEHLTKTYNNYNIFFDIFSAINDVSLDIYKGQTLGLVGSSGSGKSTLGKILIRLIRPSEGRVFYKDKDIFLISNKNLKKIRTDLQMVFQNPYMSLNNLMTVETILFEALSCFKLKNLDKTEKKDLVCDLINFVGLDQKIKYKRPTELSGGECQRVAIARSLAVVPKFIVFDEATSALDVIVQDKIIKTIKDIQQKMDLTYLFISHNIGLVKEISDNIAVMKDGKIVEFGLAKEIYDFPKHPYTKQLIRSFKNLVEI